MSLRLGLIALIAFLAAGCDPGAREMSAEEPQATPSVPARYLQGRTGLVILAEHSYPFDIQTCAIGGAGRQASFMVIGKGLTEGGGTIGIHADGNPQSVAVLVHRQDPASAGAQTYRSRFGAEDVRVDGRVISGTGEFQQVGSDELVPGRFSVSCG